jgi:hypothetical protein
MTVRRAGEAHFRGKIVPIDVPAAGTRRERVTTTMTRLAAAFEDLIADAPDQWWAVFFPIWPDLEAEAGAGTATSPGPAAHDTPEASATPSTDDATATTPAGDPGARGAAA